ncbi:MAG: hypothetical protein K9G09_03470 [Pontimonas sp.]|nr:hypothetical protein [Pontimonas sp.]
MSNESLWITGPYGVFVAEEHVLALADVLAKVARDCAGVAGVLDALPAPSEDPWASVDSAVIARHARRVEDLGREATRLAQALWSYARASADQERARVATFVAPRERLFAAAISGMSGNHPSAEWTTWGLPVAAGMILGATVSTGEIRVHPGAIGPATRVVQASGVAERIRRIPPSHTPIRIERYSEEGGLVTTEVFIAGTSDWGVGHTSNPFDLESNMALVAGLGSASLVAVEMAMKRSGVREGDRVTFVGHSQGGVIAARLAESGRYTTSGLITVGAPLGGTPVHGDYPAVSISHSDDVVPPLGGRMEPTRAFAVSRHSGADLGDVADAHSLDRYAATATELDRSPARSQLPGFRGGEATARPSYFRATRDFDS